jgi:hypothetical protein
MPEGAAQSTRHQLPFTRHTPTRLAASLTVLSRRDQPSAWVRDALYGGGLLLAAAVLALGFSTVRPTPRRKEPSVPAASYVRRDRWW